MSVFQLQIKARDEWFGSKELQHRYHTPEFYWWERYQRVYCPGCRANVQLLHSAVAGQPG